MPLVWTDTVYQTLYRAYREDGTGPISYGREFAQSFWREQVSGLFGRKAGWIIGRGISTSAPVVVVGAGFGFLCEALKDAGISNVVGIDFAPYIQSRLSTEKRLDISVISATVGIDNVNSLLQQAGFPRTYDWVIDEDAASSHSNAELPAFHSGCETLLKGNQKVRILHLVTPGPGGDTSLNWKTLAEWKATAPTHTWMNIRTGEAV